MRARQVAQGPSVMEARTERGFGRLGELPVKLSISVEGESEGVQALGLGRVRDRRDGLGQHVHKGGSDVLYVDSRAVRCRVVYPSVEVRAQGSVHDEGPRRQMHTRSRKGNSIRVINEGGWRARFSRFPTFERGPDFHSCGHWGEVGLNCRQASLTCRVARARPPIPF